MCKIKKKKTEKIETLFSLSAFVGRASMSSHIMRVDSQAW